MKDVKDTKDTEAATNTKTFSRIIVSALWAIVIIALVAAVAWWAWWRVDRRSGVTWPAPVPVPATQIALACPSPLPATAPPTAPNPQPDSQPATGPATVPGVPQDAAGAGQTEHLQVAGSTNFAVLARGSLTPKNAHFQPLSGQEVSLHPRSAALSGRLDKPTAGFLYAAPSAQQTPLAAGFVEQSVSGGDYRGLAAGPCLRPTHEAYLVGGDTKLGSSAVLELLNPADNAVTVQVQIWGAKGPLAAPGVEKVVVKARSAVQLPLEAEVWEEERLVVRVSARGAGVAAYLRVHSLVGLVPAGVAVVTPGVGAVPNQTIAGVSLSDSGGAIRLFNPSSQDHVNVAINLVADKGEKALANAQGLDIGPGQVVDVPVTGVPAGNYAVAVNASGPIVSGAVVYRDGKESPLDPSKHLRDQAWFSSTSEGDGLALGPKTVKRELIITNNTAEARTAKVGNQSYPVTPHATITVSLPEEQAAWVRLAGMHASQVITTELGDGQGITALPLIPDYSSQDQLYIQVNN